MEELILFHKIVFSYIFQRRLRIQLLFGGRGSPAKKRLHCECNIPVLGSQW